jgi:hypothetical protein
VLQPEETPFDKVARSIDPKTIPTGNTLPYFSSRVLYLIVPTMRTWQ